MTQIENITKEIVRRDIRGISGELIRIETFVHGALCMAVSGKCYMSLHEQNASANRGACTQNCRRPYKVTDLETGNEMVVDNEYIMSPKDLCTIEILDQVINAGVDVLKIEGRGKSADYVFTTTKCYKEAVEAVAAGTFTAERAAEWMKELETVYNRGFWEGYYLGRKLGEWTPNPGNAATVKKVYIAKGVRYYPNAGVGEFVVESGKMKKGDQIMIMGPNYGMVKVELDDFRVNGNDAEEAQKGDRVTFTIAEKISKSDKLYKLV
jgi:putative protease